MNDGQTADHCPTCGAPTSADAAFCAKCGTSLVGARLRNSESSHAIYEICELKWVMTKFKGVLGYSLNPFAKWTWQYIATAIGPQGQYTAYASPAFKANSANSLPQEWYLGPNMNEQDAQNTFNNSISSLLAAGWSPLETKRSTAKFRRRVV